MSIKILVIDDHGILRAGINLIISQTEGMEVVGEAGDGRAGVELARRLKPDVVLMDISMPVLNGIDAAKEILSGDANMKVLALSAHCNKKFVTDMLRVGVSGYILKDSMADDLVTAIQMVSKGEQYLSKKVEKAVIEDYVHGGSGVVGGSALGRLTLRERELLQLLAENKSTKEAARLLHVSVKTIEARRRSIMEKLGVSGIAELTKIAIREGLTSLDF